MAGAAACDDTFRPTAPSELQYSVFGFLDASADTQWVRVMPIRPLAVTAPGPLPLRVTVEQLGNGRVIELRDSAFRFAANPELGSPGLFLHNFWMTERIEPGATYRLTVRGEDGSSSGTVVEVPPDYQVEVWRRQVPNQADLLHFVGLEHVALVGTILYFSDRCGAGAERNAFTFTEVDSTLHRIPSPPLPQRRSGCGDPEPGGMELWVAGSGEAWPTGTEYLSRRLNLPDDLSEISGSVGFVGGVLTKTVPLEQCQIVAIGPLPNHCKLRYDGSTATLSGTIRDAFCGGEVGGATVRLREIDPGLPSPYRVRPTASDAAGKYEIGALQAGLRHEMSVRLAIAGVDQFQEFADTLTFAPGENVTRDISLRRVQPCPA